VDGQVVKEIKKGPYVGKVGRVRKKKHDLATRKKGKDCSICGKREMTSP